MALRKSDLYSSLWSSADELRGGMDASQYKDYVLTLLFVKYVSDKAKSVPDSLITVPAGGSFDDLVDMKGKADIGDLVNKAIVKLAEANDLVEVLTTADFDDKAKLGDGKELVDRLSNLIGIFQDIDFTGSTAQGDDLLGDAYEYLMRHFATESGKSKGQFYTPAEVSRVIAQLLEIPHNAPRSTTVYDPTCGSGSLLIKVADESPNGLSIYGQENDIATWALARMNMILHGNETPEIRPGNTLASPKFLKGDELLTFDYIVANPPFSVKTWKNGVRNDFGRFEGYDTPPDKNGDYAFLLHMVKSLKSSGRAAVIMPLGVLFRGNAEGNIRAALVKRGLIKSIVALPPNLFYGTGIPACIIVIDKAGANKREGVFMIDASRGFEKDGPKNRLRPRDMHKIVDTFIRQTPIEGYSRLVPTTEISAAENSYNLNITRYIESSDNDDIQDLSGHLHGGIPERDLDLLADYWDVFPSLRRTLFDEARAGYATLAVPKTEIAETVVRNDQYAEFLRETAQAIFGWWSSHRETLEVIDALTVSNNVAKLLSEDLLAVFGQRPLLDRYAVYEQFMSYWNSTMHDDVTLIVGEGWVRASLPRPARVWKDKNGKSRYEEADLQFGSGASAKRWVTDLVSPDLLASRYFPEQRARVESLADELEVASAAIETYRAEHAVEDGILWEAVDDEGKINATAVKRRLTAALKEDAEADELIALRHIAALFAKEATIKKALKKASSELAETTFAQYAKLTDVDVRSLVIHEKWGKAVADRIAVEVVSLGDRLIARLRLLADRYERSIPEIEALERELETRVRKHLAALGVSS